MSDSQVSPSLLPQNSRCPARLLLAGILFIFFALGLGIRLFDLTDPPFDFHPTRQFRMALITRGIYSKISDDFDAQTRAKAVSFASTMGQYEPPILETLVAYTYRLAGGEYLWISRIYTSLFWLVGGGALFALARRMTSTRGGLVALAFFLFLPFGVFASRSFQPDPGMVMWIILSAFVFYRWAETKEWKWAILTGVFCGLAVLVKVVAGYLIVAMAVTIVLFVIGLRRSFKQPQVWSMVILMSAPAVAYYLFGLEARSSEYFSNWSLALVHVIMTPGFYIQWFNHIQTLMGGAWVLYLGLVGVVIAKPLPRAMLTGLWVGYAIYGLTLPYQITTHSYYSLQLVPLVALSLAPVADLLLGQIWKQRSIWRILAVGVALVAVIFNLWQAYSVLDNQNYRQIPASWSEIAKNLPPDGKIIALTQDYGYPLMYYGWRKVALWQSLGEENLASLRGKADRDFMAEFKQRTSGKDYFLVTDFEQLAEQSDLKKFLIEKYPIFSQGEGFILYDLTRLLRD